MQTFHDWSHLEPNIWKRKSWNARIVVAKSLRKFADWPHNPSQSASIKERHTCTASLSNATKHSPFQYDIPPLKGRNYQTELLFSQLRWDHMQRTRDPGAFKVNWVSETLDLLLVRRGPNCISAAQWYMQNKLKSTVA